MTRHYRDAIEFFERRGNGHSKIAIPKPPGVSGSCRKSKYHGSLDTVQISGTMRFVGRMHHERVPRTDTKHSFPSGEYRRLEPRPDASGPWIYIYWDALSIDQQFVDIADDQTVEELKTHLDGINTNDEPWKTNTLDSLGIALVA
jgi:hypothetical protein